MESIKRVLFTTLFVLLLYLLAPSYATEYAPWFSPLFEIDLRTSYLHRHLSTFASDLGKFKQHHTHQTLHLSVDITPYPYWNLEGELLLTHARPVTFGYEASRFTLRYNCFDELDDHPFSSVTGATFTFPARRFKNRIDFLYIATAESEWHLTIGKEWWHPHSQFRLWGMAGFGVALEGSPWFHGRCWLEFSRSIFTCCLFANARIGLGNHPLNRHTHFHGYGTIKYRKIDLGSEIAFLLSDLGHLLFRACYNLYSRNIFRHEWTAQATLLLPITLF